MFPHSWIFFGVLHFIALASVLGLPFVRLYWTNLVVGAGMVILGTWLTHPFFNQPAWQWLGLMTHKPITEDYVPLLPWFGVVLIGIFLGHLLYGRKRVVPFAAREGNEPVVRALALAGRHGLVIYLVHQPLLLGVLWLLLGH